MSQKSQESRKTSNKIVRSYSPDFRQQAIDRMKSCPNISALARELNVKRTRLYKWKWAQDASHGSPHSADVGNSTELDEQYERKIAKLQQRIAELERLVGQQTLDISFFKTALRPLEELRRKKSNLGVTSSIKKSEI